jgi:hypothetical protein
MSLTIDPQTELQERELDSPSLLKALQERQDAKDDLKQHRKTFKEADDRAKALLSEFSLADGEVARIGQYKITKKHIAPKTVSFETDPTSRIQISLIPE